MAETAELHTETQTVARLFVDRVRQTPNKNALFWWDDQDAPAMHSCTWAELAASVCRFAMAIRREGVHPGAHVVLLSENRPEWIYADLAIQLLGGINIPLQIDSTAKQVCDLVEHCQPSVVMVSNNDQAVKLESLDQPMTTLVFESDEWLNHDRRADDCRIGFSELERLAERIRAEDLISILYTSGTTGEPKGVMLTHKNVYHNIFSKLGTLPLGKDDVRLAFLPMSHIFARVCDVYTWIAAGCEVYLSRGWDHLLDELQLTRPTYINAVPYFYEKCYRILEQKKQLDQPESLKNLLGGRIRVCNCGGAPIADHVGDYFDSRNVGFVTGYGLTETSPVISSCRVGEYKRGTVGPTVPGVGIMFASDGEVLVRGENVMKGYFRDPDGTADVMIDGWFHTGDIGTIDADGFLSIVGRKKELIVTTGGKNIAPIPIENQLNAHPAIEQSYVHGDRRDFLVALIVPNAEWMHRESDAAADSMRQIVDEQLNENSKYERAGRFALISEPFSVENGLLTAKRSLRREKIATVYADLIDGLYRASD